MQSEFQLIFAVLAILAAGASVAYWRQAIIAVMLLLVFEGALRKWAMPGAQAALYLAKDVLLLGAYVGFALVKGLAAPVGRARPYILLLAATAAYGAVAMLNPALPSLTLAAVGWRAYFFYIPLLFIVPYLYATQDALVRSLSRYALLALPIAALGIVQFYSPVDSPINMNVDQGLGPGQVQAFGDDHRVRAASSFSFVSGFGAYLIAVALLVGALLAARDWRVRGNIALYCGLVLIIAAMFSTGSRGPVYSLIGSIAAFSVISALTGDLSPGAAVRACIGSAILAAAVAYFLPEPAEAFRQRAMGADDTLWRFISPLIEPFEILDGAGLAGFGIGASHQSANFLTGSEYSWWTQGMLAEAESSRIMLELGILGFVLVYAFRIAIAIAALRAAFALNSRAARSLALALALFLGTQVLGAVIFNPTMNVLYWFAVGILFALYRFDEREAQLARQQRTLSALRIPRRAGGGERIRNA